MRRHRVLLISRARWRTVIGTGNDPAEVLVDQLDPSAPPTSWVGEESLAQNSASYASMFTHHPHAAYSVDRHGYYTDANGRALEMTGLSLQELRQTHFSEVIHPEDKHLLEDAFDRAMSGEPQVVEARVLRPDGVVVDIRCTGIPLVVAGEVVGIHGITEDITEAKQLVRELEEANLAKTLFLATVSHELRTPLAALVGATDLLMASDLEAEPAHFSRLIHRSGQRLMHLVQDLLEFSGLEAHQAVLHPRPFDVRELVEDVAQWAVPFAESRDLSISFVVDEAVPSIAVGDGRRITQVFTNLVQNAITFTSCGSVCVRVRCGTAPAAAETTSGTWVEFTVLDSGIGIAEEHVESLFDPFTQTDRFTAREQRGIGLGLAICRKLVDLMGVGWRSPPRSARAAPSPSPCRSVAPTSRRPPQPAADSAVTAASASTRAAIGVAPSSMRRLPWCRSYVAPPDVRVPSRAIAPGTESRNQPKSSPPRLWAVETWPCGPRTFSTPIPSSRVDSSWLTTGGTPRW